MSDPILTPSINKFIYYPIRYPLLYEYFKKAEASFWTTSEVDLASDLNDFQKLNSHERDFLLTVLSFFAAADGIVNENLVGNFCNEVQSWEARCFYGQQIAIENTHAIMYAQLIQTYVKDQIEIDKLFDGINERKSIKLKADWSLRWFEDTIPFNKRLIAFACVEGIFFSSSFCAIFYMKKRGLMPGLTFSNELISRDEGLHTKFACVLYDHLIQKLTDSEIYEIVDSAVQAEFVFVEEALPDNIIGINAEQMKKYVLFVADHLLQDLGVEKKYNAENPFEWMELISLTGKTNFFEKRVGEYQKSTVPVNSTSESFSLNADF